MGRVLFRPGPRSALGLLCPAQRLSHLPSGHVRQGHIQQHQVRLVQRRHFEGRCWPLGASTTVNPSAASNSRIRSRCSGSSSASRIGATRPRCSRVPSAADPRRPGHARLPRAAADRSMSSPAPGMLRTSSSPPMIWVEQLGDRQSEAGARKARAPLDPDRARRARRCARGPRLVDADDRYPTLRIRPTWLR